MNFVIIGNGFAGIRAIESIREVDRESNITLISDEENYSRPLISYYLGQKVKAGSLPFRGEDFFKKHKITLKIGTSKKAIKIDMGKKDIVLTDGEHIIYDRLLIATGGVPITPPIKGAEATGVFNFTTFDHAKKIESYITTYKVKTAVVLGGGLIGLKATEALMALGIKVSVIELADRILAATFDHKASGIIENALRAQDCSVITENTITQIYAENGRVVGVELKNGKRLDSEMVVIAIGVRPNIDLMKETPIKLNKGILVNQFLETNVDGVYSAGDCAETAGWVIAVLPIAARMGKIAGFNMATLDKAKRRVYSGGVPMNSVELAGVPTISVGMTDPKKNPEEYQILEKYRPKDNVYRKLILHGDNIVGAIFVNEIDRAGIFTGLIRDGVDIGELKDELMKDSFGLVSLPKNYRKHLVGKEYATMN